MNFFVHLDFINRFGLGKCNQIEIKMQFTYSWKLSRKWIVLCHESLVFTIHMNLILFMILYRNLSGMSSEESLNSRLRPGVHGKHSKSQSNELQEDLKRLIDMDIKNSDLRGILVRKTLLKKTHFWFRCCSLKLKAIKIVTDFFSHPNWVTLRMWGWYRIVIFKIEDGRRLTRYGLSG